MVGGSSILTLSAVAVDNEIVGSESEGELIWGDGKPSEACC